MRNVLIRLKKKIKIKKKIGKIFYLYVSPAVGGLLLIGGVIFIVLWCMKRKRLNKEKNIGKPKEEIVQTGESQNLKEENKCNYIIKEANKDIKCEHQPIYRLNCSYKHQLCKAHCSDINEEIQKSKLDECNIECPICKEKVIGVHLIDICEKCKEIREVKTQY